MSYSSYARRRGMGLPEGVALCPDGSVPDLFGGCSGGPASGGGAGGAAQAAIEAACKQMGGKLNANNDCVVPEPSPTCGPNESYVDAQGKCVCNPGFVRDGAGGPCVPESTGPCPLNMHLEGGVCVPDFSGPCPPNQGMNRMGICAPCAPGEHSDGQHCYECTGGSSWSESANACVCGAGQSWNEAKGACVQGGGGPPGPGPGPTPTPTPGPAPGPEPVKQASVLEKASPWLIAGGLGVLAIALVASSKKPAYTSNKRRPRRRR